MVNKPKLVVLDEPFQGMDVEMVEACKRWVDAEMGEEQTLVFVTHEGGEVPGCVGRGIRLLGGSVGEVN